MEKIEAIYIASLYEDLYQKEPLLAGILDSEGIKIGYLMTDPPFLEILLQRLGFYEILNELPIDFIITNNPLYNQRYFMIHRSMGYGIMNYEGIRFAIFSNDKDSLTIDNQIKISLLKERSDVLWIVDNNFLQLEPVQISFFIKDRVLSDTNMGSIKVKPDTVLIKKIVGFRQVLENKLNEMIYLENKTLADHILSRMAQKEGANIILYSKNLFHQPIEKDSVSLSDVMKNVACELKFKKVELTKEQIQDINRDNRYNAWGSLKKLNLALLPADDGGSYVFDLFYKE